MVSYKALNTILKAITSNRSYRGWNGYAFQTFTIFEAVILYVFYIRGYLYTFQTGTTRKATASQMGDMTWYIYGCQT